MSDRQEILDGLLQEYGGAKVLYAKEVAKELGKPSAAAARALMNSEGCPLPVKSVGGRPVVTVYDMARWLAGEPINLPQQASAAPQSSSPKRGGTSTKSANASTPSRPPRESLGKYLLSVNRQREFLFELAAELDSIIIGRATLNADSVKRPPL